MARVQAGHNHGAVKRAVQGGGAATGDKAPAAKACGAGAAEGGTRTRAGQKYGGGGGADGAVDGAKAVKQSKDGGAKAAKGGDADAKAAKGGDDDAAAGATGGAAGGTAAAACPMMAGTDGAAMGTAELLGATAAPTGVTSLPALPAPAAMGAPTGVTGIAAAPAGTPAAVAPAPAAAVQLSLQAANLIDTAAAGTGGSAVAQQVFSALKQGGAAIDVIDDATFATTFGGRTAGLFDPASNRIAVPNRIAADPAKLRLILLHEGVHWLQDNVQGGAEGLGGPIGQALQGAGAVRATQPGTKADSHHDEAQAYLLEGLTANQIGSQDSGLGVDRTGRALGYDQILSKIQATPEYA